MFFVESIKSPSSAYWVCHSFSIFRILVRLHTLNGAGISSHSLSISYTSAFSLYYGWISLLDCRRTVLKMSWRTENVGKNYVTVVK
jgi:hypothetical protein